MAHAEVLRDLGCDILQGYALARPMSPGDLLGFVSERRWLDGREATIRQA
jgi:EAL domain-containing protein (putative c-di-GMP-specific phosphodiesterase class I)